LLLVPFLFRWSWGEDGVYGPASEFFGLGKQMTLDGFWDLILAARIWIWPAPVLGSW